MKDESQTYTLRQTHTTHICVQSFFVVNTLWCGDKRGMFFLNDLGFNQLTGLRFPGKPGSANKNHSMPRPGSGGCSVTFRAFQITPHNRLAHHAGSSSGALENCSVTYSPELATALSRVARGPWRPAPRTRTPERRPDGIPALCGVGSGLHHCGGCLLCLTVHGWHRWPHSWPALLRHARRAGGHAAHVSRKRSVLHPG